MDWISAAGSLTVTGAVILVAGFSIFCFAKGWLLVPFQVKSLVETQNNRIDEANKRGDDWQAAYDKQTVALNLALGQLEKYQVVGETTNKLLASLPPVQGTNPTKDA